MISSAAQAPSGAARGTAVGLDVAARCGALPGDALVVIATGPEGRGVLLGCVAGVRSGEPASRAVGPGLPPPPESIATTTTRRSRGMPRTISRRVQ